MRRYVYLTLHDEDGSSRESRIQGVGKPAAV